MDTLFPLEPAFPDGFSYFPEFITEQEEQELIEEISKTSLSTFLFHGYEAKRKVASFGYDYHFDSREISPGQKIPPFFNPLIKKVADKINILPEKFAELLLTEYPAGSVINWHRDAPPFGLIAGISLLSDCRFMLRPYEKTRQNRKSLISLQAKRRSLYILDGPSRSEWEHSISPVKSTRYSITLRTLRQVMPG